MTPTDVSYTVSCSNVEDKALAYAMVDVQEWLQKTLTARAFVAMDDVVKSEVERMVKDPSIASMPADKFAIVMNCSRPTLRDEADTVPRPSSNTMASGQVPSNIGA